MRQLDGCAVVSFLLALNSLAFPYRLFILSCARPHEMRDGTPGILDELDSYLAHT